MLAQAPQPRQISDFGPTWKLHFQNCQKARLDPLCFLPLLPPQTALASLSKASRSGSDAAREMSRQTVGDIPLELLVAGSNSSHQLNDSSSDLDSLKQASCTRSIWNKSDERTFTQTTHTFIDLASGANHTLALVEPNVGMHLEGIYRDKLLMMMREIYVSGSGSQGQLGPTRLSRPPNQPKCFVKVDFVADCLKTVAGLPWTPSTPQTAPQKISCGWNCSYIMFRHVDPLETQPSKQDVLISLGFHRDNTFGELGCRPPEASSTASKKGVDPCVHLISFAGVLAEAGLDATTPFEILDIAAGLRHAVVGLLVRTGTEGRVIIAGWGSARHGQVGRVPEAASQPCATSKRPGPAPVIVWEPQLIFDWKTPDATSIRCKLRAGKEHTVVLVQGQVDGETSILRCIGSNKHGQCAGADASAALLKYGVTPDQIADVTCNWTTTHFLVSRQKGDARTRPLILSCGSNDHGQLGNGSRESTSIEKPLVPAATNGHDFYLTTVFSEVEKLVSGSEHSLVLGKWDWESSEVKAEKGESQVWGWGWDEHGNLAQGKGSGSRPVHDQPMLLLSPKQKQPRRGARYYPLNVWAGYGTTFILAEVEYLYEPPTRHQGRRW